MIYRILYYDEPELRQKGAKIEVFDAELKQLRDDMIATMFDGEGMGLAAQQIGKALQLCVIDMSEVEDKSRIESNCELDGKPVPIELLFPLSLVNPKVTPIGEELAAERESCMSLPGIYPPVTRPLKVKIEYQDIEGASHVLITDGLLARCAQHEVDHLNGKLTIDHLDRFTINAFQSKLKQLKRFTKDRLKKLKKS